MNKREVKEEVKKILKENHCIVIFSEGITYLHGDYDHSIASIAWSLNCIRKQTPKVYEEIIEHLESLKEESEEEWKKFSKN